ncbi:MAG TPA: VOC family protein [Acidimicrobiales bacterium]|nr:VOC family protein [Acidimicrobiales bacterium]
MAITAVTPSLTFDGKAAQAIALYERSLGAKVESIMRFKDAPPGGRPVPETHRDRVMHALLTIGGRRVMVMDAPPGVPVAAASNVQVALELDDPAEVDARFDALAQGGIVTVAPHDAFWGARFGMLVDAFGIRWILNGARARS